jgi:hypothetical protein
MADDLTDLNKHLARLLQQTMKETDPVEYDKLGAEIWRVLREQERLTNPPSCFGQKTGRASKTVNRIGDKNTANCLSQSSLCLPARALSTKNGMKRTVTCANHYSESKAIQSFM